MSGTRVGKERGALPLFLLSVVVVMTIFGLARGFWLSNIHNGLLAVAFAGIGTYVLFQRPGHREGALFMAVGVVQAVIFLGRQVGHSPSAYLSRWWAWLGVWPVVAALALVTLAVICFPDGRLPSPRWRPVVVAVIAVAALCAVLSALWPVEYESAGLTISHPLTDKPPAAASTIWSAIAHPTYAALQVLWFVAIALRWRSSGSHVRRQLIRLGIAAAFSAGALLIGLVGWGTPQPGILAAALLPLAAGWAIVHGQQRAAYSALPWLSRRDTDSNGLFADFAKAVAESQSAAGATVWMGSANSLHAIGVWPDVAEDIEPVTLEQLENSAVQHVRVVLRGAEVLGALTINRPQSDHLSIAQSRLLDDLAAQAALLIEHQTLTEIISQQRQAGQLDGLTTREQEVLELLARGLSNAAIGEQLHLSIKTVEPLVSTIFMKLGLRSDAGTNRRVLAALAYLR